MDADTRYQLDWETVKKIEALELEIAKLCPRKVYGYTKMDSSWAGKCGGRPIVGLNTTWGTPIVEMDLSAYVSQRDETEEEFNKNKEKYMHDLNYMLSKYAEPTKDISQ